MLLNGKPVSKLKEPDLRALVDSKARESKTLDFKRELPGASDSDKRKFLCDIAAFANSAGGHIVYGMEEKDGETSDLVGLTSIDLDKEILRLQGLILSGIAPRIFGFAFQPIKLSNGSNALVVGVPRSWMAPHMVTYQGASLFYARSSAGNYQLDVNELRQAFVLSETISERIRNFRLDRLSKIAASETPVEMGDEAKVIVHCVPIAAFQTAAQVDLTWATQRYRELEPIFCGNSLYRYNIDGLLTYCPDNGGVVHSYAQLFRSGLIEAVNSSLLKPEADGSKKIPSRNFETEIERAISAYVDFQHRLNVEPPVSIFLSLIGVKGYTMAVNPAWVARSAIAAHNRPIDRDILLISGMVLEDFNVNQWFAFLRPLLDAIWNAAGWPQSMNYDNNGQRRRG